MGAEGESRRHERSGRFLCGWLPGRYEQGPSVEGVRQGRRLCRIGDRAAERVHFPCKARLLPVRRCAVSACAVQVAQNPGGVCFCFWLGLALLGRSSPNKYNNFAGSRTVCEAVRGSKETSAQPKQTLAGFTVQSGWCGSFACFPPLEPTLMSTYGFC